MQRLHSNIRQAFPPAPTFTAANVGDLTGKVYLVTGANTGVGKALAGLLYAAHARVYVAARSEAKAREAIAALEAAHPASRGALLFLPLDLADLSAVRAAAADFLARESRLHVLFNNAGVMTPPQGTTTAQGYEQQLGTNCVGTFLFSRLLAPLLLATAATEPPGAVRVVWVSSSAADILSPAGGVPLDNLDYHVDRTPAYKYGVSKAGNYYHATEFARRYRASGVVSVPLNPGNLKSELARHRGWVERKVLGLFTYDPMYGAYTELFAGLSPEVTMEKSGVWGTFLPSHPLHELEGKAQYLHEPR